MAELLLEKGYTVHGMVRVPVIYCDPASSIFGAIKKFVVAVYFSIMAILRQRDSESYIAEVAVYALLKVLLEKRLTMSFN